MLQMHHGWTTTEQALKACGISPCSDFKGATEIFSCWRIWFSRLQLNSLHAQSLWAWPSFPRLVVQFAFYFFCHSQVCGVSRTDVIDELPEGTPTFLHHGFRTHPGRPFSLPCMPLYTEHNRDLYQQALPGILGVRIQHITILFWKYLLRCNNI